MFTIKRWYLNLDIEIKTLYWILICIILILPFTFIDFYTIEENIYYNSDNDKCEVYIKVVYNPSIYEAYKIWEYDKYISVDNAFKVRDKQLKKAKEFKELHKQNR